MKRVVLSLLLILAPVDLSAKSGVSVAFCIGIGSIVMTTAFSFTALGLGITAFKQNPLCDSNSAYNKTTQHTIEYTCCSCTDRGAKGQCYQETCGLTCTQTNVMCENSNGTLINPTKANNPAYWGFIGGCAAAGSLALLSFVSALASTISLCVFK